MRHHARILIIALSLIPLMLSTAGCTPVARFTRPEHRAVNPQPQAQTQAQAPKKDSQKEPHKPAQQAPVRRSGKKGTQKLLEEVVSSYIGTPYKWGGTTAGGFDCSGFVTTVYNEVYGTPLPRSSSKMWAVGRKIAQPAARPGDLVFFKGSNFGDIGHVGIYMGSNRFAHASTNLGVIYTDLDESYYARRLVGFRRVQ